MYLIYLDVCCLNRPYDDHSQPRIYLEAQAVILILERIEKKEWRGLRSAVHTVEIGRNPDLERRQRVELLLQTGEDALLDEEDEMRARELQLLGFDTFDALHIACAEGAEADVFLTTDDRLLKVAMRVKTHLRVHIENPLTWLREVTSI
jgi:hypothetical protein